MKNDKKYTNYIINFYSAPKNLFKLVKGYTRLTKENALLKDKLSKIKMSVKC